MKSNTSNVARHKALEEANSKLPPPLLPIFPNCIPLPSSTAFLTLSSTFGETFLASLFLTIPHELEKINKIANKTKYLIFQIIFLIYFSLN